MNNSGYYYNIIFVTRKWYGKIIYNRTLTGPYKWEISGKYKLEEIEKFEKNNKCIILSFEKL